MADSDRSRSPVPGRNRADPDAPAQPVRQELPFFPRWCGPMQTAIWQSQRMSRPQSRPQFRPQFNMPQPGPYFGNPSMNQIPASQSGTWPMSLSTCTSFISSTHSCISISKPSINSTMLTHTAMSTHSSGIAQHSNHSFVSASSSWHSIWELTR